MKKNILIIVNSFPPPIDGGNIRFLKFLKYLSYLNCNIDVIINKVNIDDSFLITNKLENINFHYIPTNNIRNKPSNLNENPNSINLNIKTFLKKYIVPDIYFFTWKFKVVKYATMLIQKNKINNLICTGPPFSTLIIGSTLKNKFKKNINFIADFRDLWSLSPNFKLGEKRMKFTHEYFEKKVLARSDKSIFVSESIKNYTVEKFNISNSDKYIVINNGFDYDDFNTINFNKSISNNKINLSYVGSIDGPRCHNFLPEGIQGFIDSSEKKGNVVFNFIGKFNNIYLQKIKTNCKIYKETTHDLAIQFMQNSDGLILILTDDHEGRMAFTGKFFEYLITRKPIFALVPNGEVSNIINKYNIGVCANPKSTDDIIKNLKIFIKKLENNEFNKLPNSVLNKFSRKEQAIELYNLLV